VLNRVAGYEVPVQAIQRDALLEALNAAHSVELSDPRALRILGMLQ